MNALKRLLNAVFRGTDSGQSMVEYLTIAGACALVGIAGFNSYGKVVRKDLSADAKHIEGEGLPTTEGILGSLGAEYNEIPGWCVKPNYCFAAGTPVQTARGDRAIESIVIGDRVWARDLATGAVALRSVVNTYRTARVPVVDLELSVGHVSSEHLTVTRGHLFWVEGSGWVRADALGAQPLWSTEGSTAARFSSELWGGGSELTTVYNLEVSEFHSYFVGHSHVLVHNGDPNGDGCPADSTSPASAPPPRRTGPIECGETGSYGRDLGGGSGTRPSNGMERDHIPSGKALEVRAFKLMDEVVAAQIAARCSNLSDEEQKKLAAAVSAKARKPVKRASTAAGFVLVEPLALHEAGRTYKNNNKPLYQDDARDLAVAARKDVFELQRALQRGVVTDRECAKKIKAMLLTIGGKNTNYYDDELRAIVEAQLKRLGLDQMIDTCASP